MADLFSVKLITSNHHASCHAENVLKVRGRRSRSQQVTSWQRYTLRWCSTRL